MKDYIHWSSLSQRIISRQSITMTVYYKNYVFLPDVAAVACDGMLLIPLKAKWAW